MCNTSLFSFKPWALAGAMAILSPAAMAGVSYQVTDLGVLPNYNQSAAYDINESGQVSGVSHQSGFQRGTLWDGGTLTDLGTPQNANYNVVAPWGINNHGDVVGSVGSNSYIATLWKSDGSKVVLGNLPGGSWTRARQINDSGQITGWATTVSTTRNHAFTWNETNGFTDLGTLGGTESFGIDINGAGKVVGYAQLTSNTATHATAWTNGQISDLGTLGGTNSYASAINDLGQIAGDSQITGSANRHAFIYDNGVMTGIGTLGGDNAYSYDINNSGVVVGQSQYGVGNSFFHAFVYQNGAMSDLNDLIDPAANWVLSQAFGINETGQIVGVGYQNGVSLQRAFLLTPVPEPETYALMLAGLGLVGLMARRRR